MILEIHREESLCVILWMWVSSFVETVIGYKRHYDMSRWGWNEKLQTPPLSRKETSCSFSSSDPDNTSDNKTWTASLVSQLFLYHSCCQRNKSQSTQYSQFFSKWETEPHAPSPAKDRRDRQERQRDKQLQNKTQSSRDYLNNSLL